MPVRARAERPYQHLTGHLRPGPGRNRAGAPQLAARLSREAIVLRAGARRARGSRREIRAVMAVMAVITT